MKKSTFNKGNWDKLRLFGRGSCRCLRSTVPCSRRAAIKQTETKAKRRSRDI